MVSLSSILKKLSYTRIMLNPVTCILEHVLRPERYRARSARTSATSHRPSNALPNGWDDLRIVCRMILRSVVELSVY